MAARPRYPPTVRILLDLPAVRRGIVVAVITGVAVVAGIYLQALALAHLLDSFFTHRHTASASTWVLGLFAGIALRAGAGFSADQYANWVVVRAKEQLRARFLTSAMNGAISQHTDPIRIAVLASRGLDGLDGYLGRYLPSLVSLVVAPPLLLGAVGWLDWPSLLIVFVPLLLFPVFGVLVGRSTAQLATRRWNITARFAAQVADTFNGLPVLRAFGLTAQRRNHLAALEQQLETATLASLRLAFLTALVLDTLAAVAVALVAVPLGLRLIYGHVSLASALTVLVITPEILAPLRNASAQFHETAEAAQALDEIAAAFRGALGNTTDADLSNRLPNALPRSVAGGSPDPGNQPIRLSGIVVRGDRQRDRLRLEALTLRPGTVVVVVGPNGAGKSTLLQVVAGLRVPDAGRITVGDAVLSPAELTAWRRFIGYLPQPPAVIPGTVADNLRLARPDATDAELYDALVAVGAARMVERLPQALETRIGPGGRPLSAGERQRLGLARILLRRASLYLLDEPTEHLDHDSEDGILATLAHHLAGKTALIVTHRPALTQLAHVVVELPGTDGTVSLRLPLPSSPSRTVDLP